MKTPLLSLLACTFLLSGCVHIDKTTSVPIKGILRSENGRPIAGAHIWATFELPGGLFSARKYTAFGPAITKGDGTFLVPLKSFSMVQTGTIFDGSTTPNLLIFHRNLGAFMVFSTVEKKQWPFQEITWRDPAQDTKSRDEAISTMLDEFPVKDRKRAWELIHRG